MYYIIKLREHFVKDTLSPVPEPPKQILGRKQEASLYHMMETIIKRLSNPVSHMISSRFLKSNPVSHIYDFKSFSQNQTLFHKWFQVVFSNRTLFHIWFDDNHFRALTIYSSTHTSNGCTNTKWRSLILWRVDGAQHLYILRIPVYICQDSTWRTRVEWGWDYEPYSGTGRYVFCYTRRLTLGASGDCSGGTLGYDVLAKFWTHRLNSLLQR